MGWLDLHMHSCYSDDGELTPKELMSLCKQSGIRTAALADHNTTAGVQLAQYWAERFDIVLIPSVELDCSLQGVNLHVLGYWINPSDPVFSEIAQSILSQEQKASEIRVQKVKALGIDFSSDEIGRLAKNGVVTGEVIAEAALGNDKNRNSHLLEPYYPGGQRSDNPFVNFYWDYCAQGKPAYVPIQYMGLKEAVQIIQKTGGIAVLAHPGNNIAEDETLFRQIVSSGVCGVEAYSSYHSPEQTAFYREQAQTQNLVLTCGSDFHGKTKPSIQVGCVNCAGMEAKLLEHLTGKR